MRSRSPLNVIRIELDVVVVINELLELLIGPIVKAFGEQESATGATSKCYRDAKRRQLRGARFVARLVEIDCAVRGRRRAAYLARKWFRPDRSQDDR